MTLGLVALGANLGERSETLSAAVDCLRHDPEISLLQVSSLYETAPIGGPAGQPPFLNACATIETELPPEGLLSRLQSIETELGRTRHERWDARTIDLDLLLLSGQMFKSEWLTLPHPRMSYRPFVLVPAVEIAGEMVHPEIGWTLARILDHLRGGPPHVAVTGALEPRAELCRKAAELGKGALVAGIHLLQNEEANPETTASGQCRELLSAAYHDPANRGVISDFWLAEHSFAPRLLIWLEPATPSPHIEKLIAALEQQYLGPRLNLSSESPYVVDEIAAALVALRTA